MQNDVNPGEGFDTLASLSPEQLTQLFGVRDYFTYELDFSSLANSTSASSSFTVQADSNFLWTHASVFADLSAAAQTVSGQIVPLVSCVIQDGGSGRQLMSAATPLWNIFGTGQLPFQLPVRRFFRAQSQVNVTLTNFSASSTYNLKLSFIGAKLFNFN